MTMKQYTPEQFKKEFKSLSQLQDRALADNLSIEFHLGFQVNLDFEANKNTIPVYDYLGTLLGRLTKEDKK